MTDITADVSLVGALEIETDVRGVRGESAYAIAVRNGFVGTEEEWLASLKGEQGERGEQGIQGVKGDTGATGPKGDKGDQGERGPQGEQGVKGDTGAKGDKGDPGADGQPGAKGDKGDKGDTGAKGDKGDKGDTGATGVAGAKGDDGFSPTVSVTDITGGHRVAITDASGSHTFDVMDGDAGSQGTMDYTDLTNKPSINNVTLSGNKSLSDLGIPSTSNLPDLVADWMEDNITDDPTVVIDSSLSVSGAAADAKKTGDEIADLKSALGGIGSVVNGIGENIDDLQSDLSDLSEVVDTLNDGGLDIKDDVITSQIDDWLNDHPEATTTVEDGAITIPKLNDALQDIALVKSTSEKKYAHVASPYAIDFYADSYSTGIVAKYVGSKNLIEGRLATGANNGVDRTADGRFIKLSGQSSGTLLITNMSAGDAAFADIAGKTVNIYGYVKKQNGWTINGYLSVNVNSNNLTREKVSGFASGWCQFLSVEMPSTITQIRLKFESIGTESFSDGDFYWFGMFTNAAVNTEEIISGESPTSVSVSGLEYVDSMIHQSVVHEIVPTKKYVDDHTPDIIGYWNDNVYAMPEKFGAVGDGVTDDAQALADCIAYATSNGKAVRGYGRYKTSSTIVLNGQYLDVYLREINYTGNGSAIEIQHMDIKFEFHRIVSSGAGIDFTHNNDTAAKYARRCRVIGNEIISDGNCITAQRKTLYNTCEIRVLSSANENCIEHSRDGSSDDFVAGEYVYRSSSCSCPNGYAVKRAIDSKFYDFTVERNCKYGLLDPLGVACFGWRHREQIDAMARRINGDSNLTNGALITFTEKPTASKYGFLYEAVDGINPWSIDVSAIHGYDEITSADDWINSAFNGIYMDIPVSLSGQLEGVMQPYAVIADKICFIGNNKVFIPAGRKTVIIDKAEYDYTLYESQDVEDILDAIKLDWGTDFLLDVSHSDIYLNASFGAIGYNDLTLTQADGNTAKIYDKLGNVLFDGTNEGDGKWRFRCVMDRSSNGRRGASTTAWWCYDGTNEFWEIEKLS